LKTAACAHGLPPASSPALTRDRSWAATLSGGTPPVPRFCRPASLLSSGLAAHHPS
jgi:hypothetical protein